MARVSTTTKVVIGVVAFAVLGLVVGVSSNLPAIIEGFKEGRDTAYYGEMRSSCIASANESVKAQGAETSAPDIQQKIVGYCDCIVAEAKTKLPASEAVSLDLNSPEGSAKMTQLIEACAGKLQ
jgi:hypothetical protein